MSTPWTAATVLKASKKELVDWLQANADEPFLSSRNLVGSAAAKAKKGKQSALQQHYLDWVAQGGRAAAAPPPADAKPAPAAWRCAPTAAALAPAPAAAKALPVVKPATSSGGPVETVLAAVRQLRAENPEISAKKLVGEVKARFPALEANGVKVGSKEVRESLRELESMGAVGDGAAGEEAAGPRSGLILTEASAKQLFGIVKTPATKVRGKIVPAGVEGGNTDYKLISWAWRKGVGPEGPCRRIVLRAKANEDEVWLFDMPCEAGVAVAIDPFAMQGMQSSAWILQRLPQEVIEAGKKQRALQQAAAAQAATEKESRKEMVAGDKPAPEPEVEKQSSAAKVKETESCSAVVDVLRTKIAFIDAQVKKGQQPTPGHLAQLLRAVVEETIEVISSCPSWTRELMDSQLTKLGWDRKINGKKEGAGPPTLVAVRKELVDLADSIEMMS